MPDITMCQDDTCPSKTKCYRHKASGTKPTQPYQSYSDTKHNPQTGICKDFLRNNFPITIGADNV